MAALAGPATTYGPDLPTRAELDAASAATQAVLADPAATGADRVAALEYEMAVFDGYALRPGGEAELQAEAERAVGI